MKQHELKNIIYGNRGSGKSLPPMIERADALSMLGRSITPDDDGILTVIDKRHFGRVFFVEGDGVYTVKLGVLHDMGKGALEEAAMSCTMPEKADQEQKITAVFDIPGASARFKDAVILKAAHPFRIALIEDSPILERHNTPWGVPLKYESIKTDDTVTLVRTGLRKNVQNKYRAFFDTLSIQIEVRFEK
ncbi:hypothetical protein D3Z47_17140 [Lachnospiraceae bacterium]|jgi:hypothetical protein|nr:hypothetical protein [Lachnospiraceae bacterium]